MKQLHITCSGTSIPLTVPECYEITEAILSRRGFKSVELTSILTDQGVTLEGVPKNIERGVWKLIINGEYHALIGIVKQPPNIVSS